MSTGIQLASPDCGFAVMSSKYLRIGGVSVLLASEALEVVTLTPPLEPFACGHCPADIEIEVVWLDCLHRSRTQKTFDSGATWSLFRDGRDLIFDCEVPALGLAPYKRMRVSPDLHLAQVLLNRELLGHHERVCPLDYPTDELLITNYLAAHGLGVEVHGCGLIDSAGRAHLFLGHSGAGKSTTARLWDSHTGAEILSDDRIILRFDDGELWMYGTPWHGEGQFASPNKARVERIFILQHGAANRFVPLSRSRAVGELFARSFPPFHSPEGLERTIEFLSSVAAAVPCYQFEFTPDVRSLQTVLGFHG